VLSELGVRAQFVNNLQPELLADLVLSKLHLLPSSFDAAVAAQPDLAAPARGVAPPGRASWLSEAKATLQAQAGAVKAVKQEYSEGVPGHVGGVDGSADGGDETNVKPMVGAGAAAVQGVAPAIAAPVLGSSELSAMRWAALRRIIDTGGGASSTLAPFGGRRLRSALLVRTIAQAHRGCFPSRCSDR
jgi:hypothetical protein